MSSEAIRAAVLAHLAAFNAHRTDDVIGGCTDDAVWITGTDLFRGADELRSLFDDGLWRLNPCLEVRRLLVDGQYASAELHETLTTDAESRGFDIAVFFEFTNGLIRRAKVYREGSADLD